MMKNLETVPDQHTVCTAAPIVPIYKFPELNVQFLDLRLRVLKPITVIVTAQHF